MSSFIGPSRTIVLGMFQVELSDRIPVRAVQLTVEAAIISAVSTAVALSVAGPAAGLVAMFLLSAALSDRVVTLLEENRVAIWERRETGWKANGRTASSLLFVFFGVLSTFVALALLSDAASRQRFFAFAAGFVHSGAVRDFGQTGPILVHNLGVLGTVTVLGFLYRGYGGMLSLAWNAAVWAFVLVEMLAGPDSTSPIVLLVAVAPHLLVESVAYVLGALSAMFASKAILTHDVGDSLRRALLACAALFAAAVALVAVGAVVEATWPAWWL